MGLQKFDALGQTHTGHGEPMRDGQLATSPKRRNRLGDDIRDSTIGIVARTHPQQRSIGGQSSRVRVPSCLNGHDYITASLILTSFPA